jgi:[ribosomal protein S5]-alanine N-acetyltransferase
VTAPAAPRVRIVHLSPQSLAALAARDLAGAIELSGLPLTPYVVSDERVGTWQRRAVQVVETPQDLPWVTGVLVDDETGAVVGGAGFHAAPDENGMVEAGYGVDPDHRRRGYARAALLLMIDRARSDPSVRVFRVTVSPDNTASLGLVAQLPFVEVGEQWDDEDGLETIFELDVR